MKPLALTVCSAAAILAACSDPNNADPSGSTGSGNTSTSSASSGSSGSGGSVAVWTPIITADWQLAPLSENTSDVHSLTLDRDIYVGGIRPIAPIGTHHTVLALNGLDAGEIIYASGVGTNAIMFPPGVGLKLPAGEMLMLQLHLFNTSSDTLTGTSGIEVVEVAPEAVEQEANLFLPGPLDFSIPPLQTYSHTGTCTIGTAQHLFAIFPHMHQLGTHFTATLTVGGETSTLHDGDYAFGDQAFIPFEPISVQPGDSITTTCTWNNDTEQTVIWGESSTTEMCFSILYRYPAQTNGDFCSD